MNLAPTDSSANGAQRMHAARRSKTRKFITPEGVDLELQIASAGLRFAALLIDFILLLLILLGFWFLMSIISTATRAWAEIIFTLGAFLLWNFWFLMFELGPRAATPGKRIVGIRVVARDGGRLTVSAVAARNLVRMIEIVLPFFSLVVAAIDQTASGFMVMVYLLWTAGMSFFLLFNKDRMRLGDLIGGTWVVLAKAKKMAVDLGTSTRGEMVDGPVFTPAELAVYGVFELQELERVLREGDNKLRMTVADTIRAKLGRSLAEDDRVFLTAYYRQAKARMERDLLFGKRRANKYEAPT